MSHEADIMMALHIPTFSLDTVTSAAMLSINCAVVRDERLHSIQIPATATFGDLKSVVGAVSPDLVDTPTISVALLLATFTNGRWLSTHDAAEVDAIVTGDNAALLPSAFHSQLDTAPLADVFLLSHFAHPTDIHVIAYPLGNTTLASAFTQRIRWLRRLQVVAAVAFVPSTIWAAVDAIGAQSVGTAACVATICTAIGGAAATAIQVFATHRARAVAETAATPIAELRADHNV